MNGRDDDAIRDLVHRAYGEPIAPRFDVDAGFVDLMRRVEPAEPATPGPDRAASVLNSADRPRALSNWLTGVIARAIPSWLAEASQTGSDALGRVATVAVALLVVVLATVTMSVTAPSSSPPAPNGSATAAPGSPVACGNIPLPDTARITFLPDQATFQDPAAAQATLQHLADQVVEQRLRVELIGMTSSWGWATAEGRLTLSRQRAEAVRHVLIDLGVPSDRVSITAAGTNSTGYIPDRDPDGNLLPEQAAQNRSVIARLSC